jgi:phage shock protein A
MSILSRFKAIFQARVNDIAWQFEDPRSSLDYSLTKLEENRRQLNRSLVEVSAARERLENQRNQLATGIDKYTGQASMALRSNREDLARTALERKQEAQSRQSELEANLESLDRKLENLKESQLTLDRKIVLFKSRKEELKSIYVASQAQLQVRQAISGVSEDLADVGNTIQRAEERIRELQSRADAIDKLIQEGVLSDVLDPDRDDIDHQLDQINRDQAVEDELRRLKAEAPPA